MSKICMLIKYNLSVYTTIKLMPKYAARTWNIYIGSPKYARFPDLGDINTNKKHMRYLKFQNAQKMKKNAKNMYKKSP